eukprot:1144020-Pelagomonas_calceolata.AAC.2
MLMANNAGDTSSNQQQSVGQMNVGNTSAFVEEVGIGENGVLVQERSTRRLLQVTKARAFANKLVERALMNSALAFRAELRFAVASDNVITYTISLFYRDDINVEEVVADAQRMRTQLSRELDGDSDANQELALSYTENIAGDENYGAPLTIGEANVSDGLIGEDETNDEELGADTNASVLVPAIVVPAPRQSKSLQTIEAANAWPPSLYQN